MTYVQRQKIAAVKWGRKRLKELLAKRTKSGKALWPAQSAANQVIAEAERKFNIGCARAISKKLKIERHTETEEELSSWERGEIE